MSADERKRGWHPEQPDIETVRLIAFDLAHDYDIHERAIADPFVLESEIHRVADRLINAVGLPTNVRIYTGDEQ